MNIIDKAQKVKKEFICIVCDYRYAPARDGGNGDPDIHGSLAELPQDWKCPECGAGKSCFIESSSNDSNEEECE
jgi:rubredoxin